MSKLLEIQDYGQRIWIDNLSRELIYSGQLEQLIKDDGIAGVTSNPTIFYKAIAHDKYYHNDLVKVKNSNLSAEERYEELVIPDIQAACDILLDLYHHTRREDGYVSFEVSPFLAHNTEGTIINARRLWNKINRPNLMIKIPATTEGIKAFQILTSEGININITLLFSMTQVLNTWQAYINGLTERFHKGLPVNHIKAVASFFLSRIDSLVDNKLPDELQGKTAINLSKVAYLAYKDVFDSEVFADLKQNGAKEQYLLWASTGTKNKAYSDVLYIEELIGPKTINTAPDTTLSAFKNHGVAKNNLLNNIEEAPSLVDKISKYINFEETGEILQKDGLKLFEESFVSLLELVK